MFSWFSGVKLYAAIGLLLAFVAVGGYAAYERQSALAAGAQRDRAEAQRDDLANKLAQAEIDKAELVERQRQTDAIVVAQRERERKLQDEKAQIWEQFDKLARVVPKEDQDCMARRLPDSVLEFLRDDAANADPIPKAPDSRKPDDPLSEVSPAE